MSSLQLSVESILGNGTADGMGVLHFGALIRCYSVQEFLLKRSASEVVVARGSCKSQVGSGPSLHGRCILSHAHHAVSTPSVDNGDAEKPAVMLHPYAWRAAAD